MTEERVIVERLLTYQEAGEKLGVTDRTVRKLVDGGELRCVRFDGSARIDPPDLREFIDRRESRGRLQPGSGVTDGQ